MLGNGIKQTTSTTGTGNLTLAAATGYPKMSDEFPLNFPFKYTALDASGMFIEEGVGYLSDSTTLVRARICATFVSGVYNNVNPTAASLSGTTTIICTPAAASLESMLPNIDNVSSSVLRYLTTANRNVALASNQSFSALRLYYVPFLLRVGVPIAALALYVPSATASAIARTGIYTCSEKGYPGALLATTGDIDLSTTGFKSVNLSSALTLPSGWYFTAVVTSLAATVAAYTTNANNILGGHPLGLTASGTPYPIDFRYETLASAVLPSVANQSTTGVAIGVTNPPITYLGVQ